MEPVEPAFIESHAHPEKTLREHPGYPSRINTHGFFPISRARAGNTSPLLLKAHIERVLHEKTLGERFCPENEISGKSAVLFLLGQTAGNGGRPEACLILNKRSLRVKQPGDLCFPGGGIIPGLDHKLARLVRLPVFPLGRWRHWPHWHRFRSKEARWVSLLLSTGLRESFEEMKLNPFGVQFLGPLPSHRLRMFQRKIYPMVAWVNRQSLFFPNWEVEKIVKVPIRLLFNPKGYARYRVTYSRRLGETLNRSGEDFPCFRFSSGEREEHLWGVTFRMVMSFLDIVFDFIPPESTSLPVVPRFLKSDYLTGS
jgi:hypothetical protein